MASPTYVNSTTIVTSAGNQSLTPTLPAGLAAGQLLIMYYNVATITNTIDAGPAGWNIVTIDNQIGTGTQKIGIAWTRYSAGMADPFFHLSTTSTAKAVATVVIYSANSADPTFSAITEVTSATTASVTIVPPAANTRVVTCFMGRNSPATATSTVQTVNGGTTRSTVAGTGGGSTATIVVDDDATTTATFTRSITYDLTSTIAGVAAYIGSASAPTVLPTVNTGADFTVDPNLVDTFNLSSTESAGSGTIASATWTNVTDGTTLASTNPLVLPVVRTTTGDTKTYRRTVTNSGGGVSTSDVNVDFKPHDRWMMKAGVLTARRRRSIT